MTFTEEDMAAILEKVSHVKAVTPNWSLGGTVLGRKGQFSATGSFGTPGLQYASNDPLIKVQLRNVNR